MRQPCTLTLTPTDRLGRLINLTSMLSDCGRKLSFQEPLLRSELVTFSLRCKSPYRHDAVFNIHHKVGSYPTNLCLKVASIQSIHTFTPLRNALLYLIFNLKWIENIMDVETVNQLNLLQRRLPSLGEDTRLVCRKIVFAGLTVVKVIF